MIKDLAQNALHRLDNSTILVTGGTGTLGQAFLRRIRHLDVSVKVLSRDESRQGKVAKDFPNVHFMLGDVAREKDVHRAMRGVDYVFHFAAYKQVPSSQNNVTATIETNIVGSQNVCDAAIQSGVKQVVASSTDKACAPANFYGVSKAAMESIFQHANKLANNDTIFTLARYGNVIGSNGSVIPLFENQIRELGYVTLTDGRMTRFWISVEDAVDLILASMELDPGEIVVPKAAALSVARIADYVAGYEVDKVDIGIRPGEKIHEAMVSLPESFHTLTRADHFVICPPHVGAINSVPFEYTSDTAPELSYSEFLRMMEDYQ